VTPLEARERFAGARVARLATADSTGRPHLVPVVFATEADVIYSAVDAKPKRSTALRRLANIAANPLVTLLVDHYSDDWSSLWWVRADGVARVLDPAEPEAQHGIELLVGKYPQYRELRPAGPTVAVDVERWSGWSAS
jgi:PPOX class probable F420-dependent enzyme